MDRDPQSSTQGGEHVHSDESDPPSAKGWPGRLLALAAATTAAALMTQPVAASEPTKVGPIASDELHVMSFNLRFASDQSPNSWADRRPVMRKLLRDERPDIIGTQEGLFEQLNDIDADLANHYASIGEGRERRIQR